MARLCPHTNKRVVYMTCMDCEDRICEEDYYPENENVSVKNDPNQEENKTHDEQ